MKWVLLVFPFYGLNPMDYGPPDSSIHGISQASVLESPFTSPGDHPISGIKPESPPWQVDSLLLSHLGSLTALVLSRKKSEKFLRFLSPKVVVLLLKTLLF